VPGGGDTSGRPATRNVAPIDSRITFRLREDAVTMSVYGMLLANQKAGVHDEIWHDKECALSVWRSKHSFIFCHNNNKLVKE
jgi:hypothetical protein